MNQQSCQKALLKCSKINKRMHKDEQKVKRLLSRLMKELPSNEFTGSQETHAPQQHRGSLLYDSGSGRTQQELKCDLNQKFSERQSDSHGLESPTKATRTPAHARKENQKRRRDADSLVSQIWRSHQNAVKMEKMVSRAIEAFKKSPAEESPCNTIVSQSEHTRYKDTSHNNQMKNPPPTLIDLGQFMQWVPPNKQVEYSGQANRGHSYGQIQISAQQVLTELERSSAADLSRMLPSQGVKSLDKLRPPPSAPRHPLQGLIEEKTASVDAASLDAQQPQYTLVTDAAKTTQQQLIITKVRQRPNNQTVVNEDQVPLSQSPLVQSEIAATNNQPNQLAEKKAIHAQKKTMISNSNTLEESPQKLKNEKRQRGRPRKNMSLQDEFKGRTKVSRQGSVRGSQRGGQLQRQQSGCEEEDSLQTKKTPNFRTAKKQEYPQSDEEESKLYEDDEEEEQTIERSVKTTEVVATITQTDNIPKKQQDVKGQEFTKPSTPILHKQVLTDDTTRPSGEQDSEERQGSKESIQSELHENSAGPESEDEEDESDESSSSEEDCRMHSGPKRAKAEKALFKPPSVIKSQYLLKRTEPQCNFQVKSEGTPQTVKTQMNHNASCQQFTSFEEHKLAPSQDLLQVRVLNSITQQKNVFLAPLPKQDSVNGLSRVRSIDQTYPELGDHITGEKRLRIEYDREGNSLTPTPIYIENPEISLGGPSIDLYGGARWGDAIESPFGVSAGFSHAFLPQQRAENIFDLNYDVYDQQYAAAPGISPNPSPALGASTALPYKSLGANGLGMNLTPVASRHSFQGGFPFGQAPTDSFYQSAFHLQQQSTAVFEMMEEVASPGDLKKKNALDSQGE